MIGRWLAHVPIISGASWFSADLIIFKLYVGRYAFKLFLSLLELFNDRRAIDRR